MRRTDTQSESKKKMRAGFIWNAVYAVMNAVQSAVILFAISRVYDITVAGVITIGFTIGNLAAIIARYGIRNYQVTDVNEQFDFSDYYWSRIVSVSGTLIISLGYFVIMLSSERYSVEKSLIVFAIILLKIEGAIEEVFVSRLQQKGRLDVGARIAAFRLGGSTLVIFTTLWIIPNLLICLLLGIVAEILIDVMLIPTGKKYTDFHCLPKDSGAVKKLLKAGAPLCIGTALYSYAGNAPKYLVDLYLTDELQAVCGYVMMPMFMLTVMNTFVMQPAIKGLGDAWNTDPAFFWKKVVCHILLISALAAIVLGAGYFIGLPIMSMLYKVDLLLYRKEFLILMAGGGLYTISAYMIVILTTMRRQIGLVWGCGAAALIYLALGSSMNRNAGFTGICWLYVIANLLMSAVFVLIMLKKGERGDELAGISGKDAASDS